MTESITIQDANELKMLLEERIAEMIDEFERKTELTIVDIELDMDEDGGNVVTVRALL